MAPSPSLGGVAGKGFDGGGLPPLDVLPDGKGGALPAWLGQSDHGRLRTLATIACTTRAGHRLGGLPPRTEQTRAQQGQMGG